MVVGKSVFDVCAGGAFDSGAPLWTAEAGSAVSRIEACGGLKGRCSAFLAALVPPAAPHWWRHWTRILQI